jgi:hypothetical protein
MKDVGGNDLHGVVVVQLNTATSASTCRRASVST